MPSSHANTSANGRSITWLVVWFVIFLIGTIGWAISLASGDAHRAMRALLINFIYFTPLTLGMAAWPAVVMASHGHWMGTVKRTALAAVAFAPVSLLALIALWIGVDYWAPWAEHSYPKLGAWLNPTFVMTRNLSAVTATWLLAGWFVWRANRGRPSTLAPLLVLVYCLTFSLVGFDLVMALDPHWHSSLFGGYFFISGMYLGIAGWTFATLVGRPDVEVKRRHDMGKLIFAFALLTTYMMFCQLLPIWYENLPHEVRQVIPRLNLTPWRSVSVVLLATIYLGPLVMLLPRWAKRKVAYLAPMALAVLTLMWVERWWLVTPTLGGKLAIGVPELSLTAAFAAALAFLLNLAGRLLPPTRGEES